MGHAAREQRTRMGTVWLTSFCSWSLLSSLSVSPTLFFFFFGCLLCTLGNNACLMPLLWAVQSRDTVFYDTPRLVYHIDEFAVGALTSYYARTLPPKADVLDCTSGGVGPERCHCVMSAGRGIALSASWMDCQAWHRRRACW